jgi:hypothetical protein
MLAGRKKADLALQFLIPAIGCQGMMMLFPRDQNPWTAWLPMIDINKANLGVYEAQATK